MPYILKKTISIFLSFLLAVPICLAFIPINDFAIQAQSSSSQSSKKVIADAEEKRKKELTEELQLTIPSVTDDPNQTITFKSPNKNEPVTIQVNDKQYTKAKSPFSLPSLNIGKHQIIFKYKNKEGLLRVLSLDLIVIPRAPSFSESLPTQIKSPDTITVSGQTIPSAQVKVVIDSTTVYSTSSLDDGQWQLEIKDLDSLEYGQHSVMALSFKNGYASQFSDPYQFNLQKGSLVPQNNGTSSEPNSINDLINQVSQFVRNNQRDLLIISGGILALLIVILINRFLSRKQTDKQEKTIADLLKLEPTKVSLRERLEGNNDKAEKQTAKTQPKPKASKKKPEAKPKPKPKQAPGKKEPAANKKKETPVQEKITEKQPPKKAKEPATKDKKTENSSKKPSETSESDKKKSQSETTKGRISSIWLDRFKLKLPSRKPKGETGETKAMDFTKIDQLLEEVPEDKANKKPDSKKKKVETKPEPTSKKQPSKKKASSKKVLSKDEFLKKFKK